MIHPSRGGSRSVQLTAALIVRDEAVVLEDCLRSIRGVADEIVVVDTGSADDSIQVAERHGARVFEVAWRGDFAAARNEALGHARGQFVLYIDADERLGPVDRAYVDGLLADDSVTCYTVLFRPQRGYTRYREYRIWRNHPRIRFRGVIHETMLPAIREVAAQDGGRIADTELAIDHVGYEGDQQRKHRRNLPLLRARVEADPAHVFSWHHLGRALAGLGDADGAAAAWRRGIEVVRAQASPSPADSLLYGSLLRQQLDAGQLDEALVNEARARFPGNHLIAWLHGRRLMAAGRLVEAIETFEQLTAIDPRTFLDPAIAYDERIFGVWAFDALGLCCWRLGCYAESASWYARAEAAAPADGQYRAKRRLAEARLRRPE
jgi:tetratricopeptide (TPR) repeat protein